MAKTSYTDQIRAAQAQNKARFSVNVLADLDKKLAALTPEAIEGEIQKVIKNIADGKAHKERDYVVLQYLTENNSPAFLEYRGKMQPLLDQAALFLDGYRNLHEICRNKDIAVEVDLKASEYKNNTYYSSREHCEESENYVSADVCIFPSYNYRRSPHANIFFPEPGLLRRVWNKVCAKTNQALSDLPEARLLTDGTKKPKALVPGGSAGG